MAKEAAPSPAESAHGDGLAAPPADLPPGLTYTSDDAPGIRRVRSGRGFFYRDAQGRTVRDRQEIERIRKLAIPPAYEDVWICPRANGHLQATGRDSRGRKQYRYHPDWRAGRDSGKYDRLPAFAKALPAIRRRVRADLKGPPLARATVLATMVRLLDTTFIRVGNDEYARENGSYGLTTLRRRHARIAQGELRLSFKGKSGVRHEVAVRDPRVVAIVRQCLPLPGQELFCYKDADGQVRTVSSTDINDYLRDVAGERFTAKDFRTWHGTVLAWQALCASCAADPDGAACFTMKTWLAGVAGRLGNTPAVCRKAYIHPHVLGAAVTLAARKAGEQGLAELRQRMAAPPGRQRGLHAPERGLLAYLAACQPPRRRNTGVTVRSRQTTVRRKTLG